MTSVFASGVDEHVNKNINTPEGAQRKNSKCSRPEGSKVCEERGYITGYGEKVRRYEKKETADKGNYFTRNKATLEFYNSKKIHTEWILQGTLNKK